MKTRHLVPIAGQQHHLCYILTSARRHFAWSPIPKPPRRHPACPAEVAFCVSNSPKGSALMEHPAAPGLAARLGGLPHTNKRGERGEICLPGFRHNAGANPEAVGENGLIGLAVAEAVIETLDENGFQVIATDEIDARAQALAVENAPDAESRGVRCNRCQRVVFNLAIATGDPVVDLSVIAMGIEAHQAVCE